jgi:hypothetical protein
VLRARDDVDDVRAVAELVAGAGAGEVLGEDQAVAQFSTINWSAISAPDSDQVEAGSEKASPARSSAGGRAGMSSKLSTNAPNYRADSFTNTDLDVKRVLPLSRISVITSVLPSTEHAISTLNDSVPPLGVFSAPSMTSLSPSHLALPTAWRPIELNVVLGEPSRLKIDVVDFSPVLCSIVNRPASC